ncbi:hypothetical protein [Streptomyces sp. KN37]|uniref:hypothetical protein n=1 Tax=Streptomyces sp. KN37 TaxID=3090667 RepID=UPI002A75AF75|nr:hypothetical protein [Streptomyces sp. KN37]WPO74055.1 hypothetical protein R9806_27250 [Streptomyces sp. KN37]
MDEPTHPPPSEEVPQPIVARSRLAPVQEAYGAWAGHQLACDTCRDIDAGPCPTAARLRRAWEALAHQAVRRVVEGPR